MGPGAAYPIAQGRRDSGAICSISASPRPSTLNNLELLKIDVAEVDALILSHGHFDHFGGLIGFLEAQRAQMRKDLRLYTGGEDNFCHRLNRSPDGSFIDFGSSRPPRLQGAGR